MNNEDLFTRTTAPLANLRDLGGTRVASGVIKSTMLFRSDDLSLSPVEEIQGLVDAGLAIVLDLRSPTEQDLRPHTRLVEIGVPVHSLSFIDDAIDPQTAAERMTEIVTALDLGRWYAQMAEDASGPIVRGLEIIASSTGSVLFHCAAGKDRTGVFSAAVLSILEADIDVIVEDYARTDAVIDKVLTRLSTAFLDEGSHNPTQWTADMFQSDSPLLRAFGDTARSMVEELEARHGGMRELLRQAGLRAATEEELVAKLVE